MPTKKTQKNTMKPKSKLGQNMLIAIIGAIATILAGTLPRIIDLVSPEPTPTYAPPTSTFTTTPTLIPTVTPTFTAEPPTQIPTTPLGIYNVYLTIDQEGQFRTNVFTPEQYIYVFYSVNDPSRLNNVKIVWYAVKAEGFRPNIVINQSEQTITKEHVSMQVKTDPVWATGAYKIEIYLNGVLGPTLDFEVKR